MSRIIAPRFELVLHQSADGWYVAADLLRPTARPVPVEGPYSRDYAALRLRSLVPREVAETLLTLAGTAVTTGRAAPVHHLDLPH